MNKSIFSVVKTTIKNVDQMILDDKEFWKGEKGYTKLNEISDRFGRCYYLINLSCIMMDTDSVCNLCVEAKEIMNDYVRQRNSIIDEIIADKRSWNPASYFKNKFIKNMLHHHKMLEGVLEKYELV